MLGILLLGLGSVALISLVTADDDPAASDPQPADDDTPTDDVSNEIIRGGDGDNALTGAAGDDLIRGFLGDDTLRGGAGDDLLVGSAGADDILGGNGGDLLIGGADNDTLLGLGGDDDLYGNGGNDRLGGGDGADVLIDFSGADTLDGGAGNDFMSGVDLAGPVTAADQVGFTRAELGSGVQARFGDDVTAAEIDRIFAEVRSGAIDRQADVLRGNAGDDTLIGDAGDSLTGGAGLDSFGIYTDPAAPAPDRVVITDFDKDDDALEIIVEGDATGSLQFTEASGGAGTFVSYDNRIIAFVRDVTPADLSGTTVVTRDNV